MQKDAMRHAADAFPDAVAPPYDVILALHGFDTLKTITEHLGGYTGYIPSLRNILAQCIEKCVMVEYNGVNTRELCRRYGYSEHHIRRLIKSNGR
jgi:Mor family transcriptional regulator